MSVDFFDYIRTEIGITPDEEQRRATACREGINIITAGPGSGKSTVMMCRMLYLIKEFGAQPWEITALVFNREAKKDLTVKVKKVFDKEGITVPHIYTIHGLCYRIAIEHGLIPRNCTIASNTDRKVVDKIKELHFSVHRKDIKRKELEDVLSDIGLFQNGLCLYDEKKRTEYDKKYKGFCRLYSELAAWKKTNKLVGYDDIQSMVLELLRENPGKLSHRYEHLLVDEAQDITALQFEIIRELHRNYGKDLYLVGDDDQCIYTFRGATSEFIRNPGDYFAKYNRYQIGHNYRCDGGIVRISDLFIKQNQKRTKKVLTAVKEASVLPKVKIVSRELDQYRFIRDFYLKKVKDTEKTLCVLYRNNSSAVLPVNFMLEQGIDVQYTGTCPDFFIDFYAVRILNEIKRMQIGRGPDHKVAFLSKPRPDMLIRHIMQERNIQNDKGETYKILMEIAKRSDSTEEFLDKMDLLTRLFNRSDRKADNNSNAVVVTSIHSSKGLEYDYVIMIDLLEGIFPGQNEKKEEKEFIEEERRLFYVAMTRAKRRLLLLVPQDKKGRLLKPSRFVNEISCILEANRRGLR